MDDKQRTTDSAPVVRRVTLPSGGSAFPTKSTTVLAEPAKPTTTPRTRVTAADVEAKVNALLVGRRTRKLTQEPRRMATLVRAVAASAMGIGIIGFGLGISSANAQHAVDLKAIQDQEATVAAAPAEASPADGNASVQKLTGELSSAQKRSDDLAAAQQEFAAIAYAGNAEAGTNDGRPKPSVLKSVQHRKTLAGFFAPESLLLSDAQAYSFRTEDLLGPGRIDPRQPWFTRYGSAGNPADPGSYTWTTAAVSPSGTPGVMGVVWINKDTGTGELLAWATGRYSVKTGTFTTLTVNRTTQGENQQLKPETTGMAMDALQGAKL